MKVESARKRGAGRTQMGLMPDALRTLVQGEAPESDYFCEYEREDDDNPEHWRYRYDGLGKRSLSRKSI